MNVSIIIPIHKPDKSLLKKVIIGINKQEFKDKIEIIKVDKKWGLAKSLNYGIKKSKYRIIVTIHQDCIPKSNDWLSFLLKPLEKDEIVATCSKIYDLENKKIYTPLLDEKGCAYKKEALAKINYFDEKTFLNSGEDMDLYMKLKKIGKIEYPDCMVEHYHKGYLIKKSEYKIKQNANTWGCLFRIYGFKVPGVWGALLKANIFKFDYFYWFWRGFLKKKQDFRR
ncbi:MAG: glycosyltransferase [Nanoarchaeota archaeon]